MRVQNEIAGVACQARQAALCLAVLLVAPPLLAARPHAQDGARQVPPSSLHMLQRPGYLGVTLRDMDAAEVMRLHLHGALIATVDRDAPAWTAGLRPRDIVVAINGQAVDGVEMLSRRLHEVAIDETITLHVWHAGTVSTVPVTLGDESKIAQSAMDAHTRSHDSALFPQEGSAFVNGGDAAGNAAQPSHPKGMASSLLNAITPTAIYSGLSVDPLSPQLAGYFGVHAGSGLLVSGVQAHSPAADAGLQAGDVLLCADSRELKARGDLDHALRASKGDAVLLEIVRDKHTQFIHLTPDRRKAL